MSTDAQAQPGCLTTAYRLLKLPWNLIEGINQDEHRLIGLVLHLREGAGYECLEDCPRVRRRERIVQIFDALKRLRIPTHRAAEHRSNTVEEAQRRGLLLVVVPAEVPRSCTREEAAEQHCADHRLAGPATSHQPEELWAIRVIKPMLHLSESPLSRASNMLHSLLGVKQAEVVRRQLAVQS